jgi:hypothetical protein
MFGKAVTSMVSFPMGRRRRPIPMSYPKEHHHSRDDEGLLSRRGQSYEGIERADAERLEMPQIAR